MFTTRLKRIIAVASSVFAFVGLSVVGAALPAVAYSCTINFAGDGSQANPWVISNSDQLDCFAAGYSWIPAGGGDAYFIQTADLTRNINIPIHANSGAPHFHWDGQGHTITIDSVANFTGLFMSMNGNEVKNLSIAANNSTLNNSSGWFAAQDLNSTFTNVSSSGPISTGSGGIVGQADGTTISASYTTGIIGTNAGGIVGENSSYALLSNVYSTGLIGNFAGGIVGANSDSVSVNGAYSLGNITDYGGGIFGSGAFEPSAVNVYSIGHLSSNAGGIVGSHSDTALISHAYSANSPLSGTNSSDTNVVNSLTGSGVFSASQALTVLAPASAWAECASVNPDGFYLTAITPVNPCNPPAPSPSPSPSSSSSSSSTELAQTGSAVPVGLLSGAAGVIVALGLILLLRKRFER